MSANSFLNVLVGNYIGKGQVGFGEIDWSSDAMTSESCTKRYAIIAGSLFILKAKSFVSLTGLVNLW